MCASPDADFLPDTPLGQFLKVAAGIQIIVMVSVASVVP